nr:hypothetical protein [Tanacetum cinerariifolium]
MIWHATGKCTKPDKMQHPVDGRAWKNFDTKYLDFAKEPRNVRLGLAADGFNPFGNLSQAYSMWPVILTTYNLPPLSGWSGQGYKACPTCHKDTPSVRVFSKTAYVGHRRFLNKPHKWRSSREFNGQIDNRDPPKEFGRDKILAQLDRLPTHLTADDPDIIHFDNSSDLPLSTSLNDLDNATLHIDGQSTEVDTPPDIIDVVDEYDDIIDDEDPIPRDLADSDDEDLINVDDDGEQMETSIGGRIGPPSRASRGEQMETSIGGRIGPPSRASREDDPDIIHFDNSSDLPLSTSLNGLDNATLHIDGQSTEVDTPPDIIDVVDEYDDIIDDENPLPRDLADSDDEDLINVDDDGVHKMSANVARSYDGDDGGKDRPPPHHVPTGCGGYFANRGKGKRKLNLGSRAVGRLHTHDKT